MRAGTPGDEFFVIERGMVEVAAGGRHLGPGAGSGEIALIRDVPRTTTVRALTEVRIWALERRPFLGAVLAHADATRAADAVIFEHLARARRASPDVAV